MVKWTDSICIVIMEWDGNQVNRQWSLTQRKSNLSDDLFHTLRRGFWLLWAAGSEGGAAGVLSAGPLCYV